MNRRFMSEKGMPAMGWRNMGRRRLSLLKTELKRREKQRYGGKKKMLLAAGSGAKGWMGKSYFLLTGILLCAVPKCIACHYTFR